jgi:DNA-binding NtrC family response regulator
VVCGVLIVSQYPRRGRASRSLRSKADTFDLGDWGRRSAGMERARLVAERAARSSLPVLIEGEKGVGKEFLARRIHAAGPRRHRPFVKLACADLRDTATAAALFGQGHEGEGGKLLEARRGTLYLDEIGALCPAVQARLAETLSEGDGLGRSPGWESRPDFRLMASASRQLLNMVEAGGFREDLFYRLNILPIRLPPLRERTADIADLALTFLLRHESEARDEEVTGISVAALEMLRAYSWPGNLRELEHAVSRAIALCDGGDLTPDHFPQISGAQPPQPTGESAAALVADQRQAGPEAPIPPAPYPDRNRAVRYGSARLVDERGELRRFDRLEEEVIRFAIGHCGGRMSEVARRLGIGRSTLYRKLRDYGIAVAEAR